MPDPTEKLDEGRRREQGGALEGARACFESAAAESDDPDLVAEALWRLAHVHRVQCRWDEALEAARRSAEVAERAGLAERQAEALNAQAAVHMSCGAPDDAAPLLERILVLSPDPRVRGVALQNLGTIAAQSGDLDAAERHFADSYACFKRVGYMRGEAMALNNQGRAALDRGRHEDAARVLEQAHFLARELPDLDLVALASLNLAEAFSAAGRDVDAQDMATTALGFFSTASNAWRRVECLRLIGDIHHGRGDRESALACWEQARALARDIGAAGELAALDRRMAGGPVAGAGRDEGPATMPAPATRA